MSASGDETDICRWEKEIQKLINNLNVYSEVQIRIIDRTVNTDNFEGHLFKDGTKPSNLEKGV